MCKPDAMPDLSDPHALSLVLCLLEVDGEKFGELSEIALDEIPYILGDVHRGSDFYPEDPPFAATWVSIACEVDAVFTPALIEFPTGTYKEVPPQQPGSGSLTVETGHKLHDGGLFFFGGGEQIAPPETLDLSLLENEEDAFGMGLVGASGDEYDRDDPQTDNGQELEKSYGGDGFEAQHGYGEGKYDHADGMGNNGSYEMSMMDDGFVPPEQASDIVFPKIFSKQELPDDTVGAIYSANTKTMGKSTEKFPSRLSTESIQKNSHMNSSSVVHK
jgi:hypothetical protein